MIEYVRVEEEEIVEVGLPKSGLLRDATGMYIGETVSGYNLLPEEVLLAQGWVPVIDEGPPEYNTEFISGIERKITLIEDTPQAEYFFHYREPNLSATIMEIIADGESVTTVIFRHPNPETRPEEVVFYVNEEPMTVGLLENGEAHLDVAAIRPGVIDVQVENMTLEITAREVEVDA